MSANNDGASCFQCESTGLGKTTPVKAADSTSFTAAPPTDIERDDELDFLLGL